MTIESHPPIPMPSEWAQKAVDWVRGDDAIMFKQVPEALGKKHVTELLHQHPWHPFVPDMERSHPCFASNQLFGQCMAAMPEHFELHMKHVNCYHPYKTDLMKCLVRYRKSLAAGGSASSQQTSPT